MENLTFELHANLFDMGYQIIVPKTKVPMSIQDLVIPTIKLSEILLSPLPATEFILNAMPYAEIKVTIHGEYAIPMAGHIYGFYEGGKKAIAHAWIDSHSKAIDKIAAFIGFSSSNVTAAPKYAYETPYIDLVATRLVSNG